MIEKQIINLIEARDQAHIKHWATTNYEEHKTLGEFYEGLTDLLDKFVETYFGKFGRVDITGLAELHAADATMIVTNALANAIIIEGTITEPDLLNILADIRQLCNQTLYKLTLK